MLSALPSKGPFCGVSTPLEPILAEGLWHSSLLSDATCAAEAVEADCCILATSVGRAKRNLAGSDYNHSFLSDRVPPFQHFSTGSLAFRGVVTAMNVSAPRILEQVQKLPLSDQAEMDRLIDDGEFPNWKHLGERFWLRWGREFARTLLIVSTHRAFDALLVAKLSPEEADLFMRNLKKAAAAEYEETGSRLEAVMHVATVALGTLLVGQLAALTVNSAFVFGDLFYDGTCTFNGPHRGMPHAQQQLVARAHPPSSSRALDRTAYNSAMSFFEYLWNSGRRFRRAMYTNFSIFAQAYMAAMVSSERNDVFATDWPSNKLRLSCLRASFPSLRPLARQVGSAVGTLIWPGPGTQIGPQIATLMVDTGVLV